MTKQLTIIFAVVLGMLLVGCGPSGKLRGLVPVSGVVFFEDKPVSGASVLFAPKDGAENLRAASAVTDAEGKFIMRTLRPNDGVLPGDYTVIIRKTEHAGKYQEETLPSGEVRGRYTDPRVVDKLPKKYSDARYSDLSITVPPEGNQNAEFRLQGKVDLTPQVPKRARRR